MRNQDLFEQIQRRIAEVLAQSPARDVEANLKAMMAGLFSRLDLVTREEFDVQREVLLRTREKLDQLEARLAQIEGTAKSGGDSGG
jgi:BMFP domain-containing protein YqiC